jgi:hypothetical protein
MKNTDYSLEKSVMKAVKYPVFGLIASYILKILGIVIAGVGIQFPEEVNLISQKPGLFLGLALIIFVYDWLKHRVGVNLP